MAQRSASTRRTDGKKSGPYTQKEIAAAKLPPDKKSLRMVDGKGLSLDIRRNSRRYVYTYSWQGQRPEVPIGPEAAITLAKARLWRELFDLMVINRVDPRRVPQPLDQDLLSGWLTRLTEARIAGLDLARVLNTLLAEVTAKAMEAVTFEADVLAFYAREHRLWDAKTARQFLAMLRNHAKPLLSLATIAITRADVLACVEPLWLDRPRLSSDLLNNIARVIETAILLDQDEGRTRSGERPINPAHEARRKLDKRPAQDPEGHAAMDWHDLPAFYAALDARPEIEARALQFLLANGCPRTAEVLHLPWAELKAGYWRMPAGRSKSGRPRTNRLSQEALRILERVRTDYPPHAVWVFPGTASDGYKGEACMRRLLHKMGHPVTVHGLRASITGWLMMCHRHLRPELDVQQDHVREGQHTSLKTAYDREELLESRHELCALWATYLRSTMDQAVALAA